MARSRLLTLPEAARLVDRAHPFVCGCAAKGTLVVTIRDGRKLVAVTELIRVGWLGPDGAPLRLPDKLGLPLLEPLDREQLLTKQEVAELLGASVNTVSSWVHHGRLRSSLVTGWPGKGNRKRRLISVGELVRLGVLTEAGQSTFVHPLRKGSVDAPLRASSQRSIPDDLPVDLSDRRIGIEDRELAKLVLACLSRFLASDGSRYGDGSYGALRLLRLYAHTDVTRADIVHPAPCPEVDPELRIPTGRVVARNLGLPARHRREEWDRLMDADPVTASFDVNYVVRHVPPPLWRVVAALVNDGPALANARLRRIIFSESRRTIERGWGGRDTSATVTEKSLRGAVSKFRRFYCAALVPMHYDGYPSRLLEPWSQAPPPLKITGSLWQADRSAPSSSLLRLGWQQLDGDVRSRLVSAVRSYRDTQPSGDIDSVDALQLVRGLPSHRLHRASLFRATRNRALLAVFAVLGGRKESIMDLDRGDYKHDFLCPDGTLSAAFALRPGKHAPPGRISWKPIPAEMAQVIDLYLLVVERLLGTALPENGPLFISSLAHAGQRLTGSGFNQILGGTDPLLPKPRSQDQASKGSESIVAAKPVRAVGYSPQTLRRAALQLVRRGARSYCLEHDIEADPECLAEVLLDHKRIQHDTMGYADINTVQGRIRWSQVATAITWEMLTTDRGARRVPNERRFREALELQQALQGELMRADRELDQLFEARYTAVSDELIVELMVASHRVREIEKALADVATTIVTLEHDGDSWLILRDDEPDQKIDLKAVRRGERATHRRDVPDRVRWFFTVPETAEFAGSPATARRWAGGQLPFPEGDPRNPWQLGDGAVDASLGIRRRRIDVDKINPRYFDTSAKRSRRDEILATIPRGFTPQECRSRPGGIPRACAEGLDTSPADGTASMPNVHTNPAPGKR